MAKLTHADKDRIIAEKDAEIVSLRSQLASHPHRSSRQVKESKPREGYTHTGCDKTHANPVELKACYREKYIAAGKPVNW